MSAPTHYKSRNASIVCSYVPILLNHNLRSVYIMYDIVLKRVMCTQTQTRSARANFGHAHLQNGKVEVQIITENAF